jgi:hypothetical protein
MRRNWLALGALAGIAVLLTAGFADAKLKTVSKSTTITTGAPTVKARCPTGSEAVSGGFANPDFDPSPSTPQIFPFNSLRGGDRVWKASGFNMESESGTFTVFGYCDRHEPGLKAKSKETTLAPGELGSATARCPRESEAVSGGFSNPDFGNFVSPSADIMPSTSKRVGGRSWKATGYNRGDADGTFVALAYCDKHQPGLSTRSKDVSILSEETGSVTAKCPKGRGAVAGGFDGHAIDTIPIGSRGAFTYTSKRRITRGWKASAQAFGDSTLTSYAYCKRAG